MRFGLSGRNRSYGKSMKFKRLSNMSVASAEQRKEGKDEQRSANTGRQVR